MSALYTKEGGKHVLNIEGEPSTGADAAPGIYLSVTAKFMMGGGKEGIRNVFLGIPKEDLFSLRAVIDSVIHDQEEP